MVSMYVSDLYCFGRRGGFYSGGKLPLGIILWIIFSATLHLAQGVCLIRITTGSALQRWDELVGNEQ